MQIRETVSVPRPPRTRKRRRAALIVHMHPDQLGMLHDLANHMSMSFSDYVTALLFADADEWKCPHGIPRGRTGAAACVRCRGTTNEASVADWMRTAAGSFTDREGT